MVITSKAQVSELRNTIYENAQKAYLNISEKLDNGAYMKMFSAMKFNKCGFDPIKGTPLNFIEQLNQMFSDLVVLYAVEELLSIYPDKQFEVNFGSAAGFDIQSIDEAVVAECFAVTTVESNNKLHRDAKKLIELAPHKKKYIYFYSENDSAEKLAKTYMTFQEVCFQRIRI